MNTKQLLVEQMDRKFKQLISLANIPVPSKGWINAVRKATGMKITQLAPRLNMSQQGFLDMEKREVAGSVSINTMKSVAKAMDMKFVYALVPKDGSIEQLIDRRAKELATKIVTRTASNMALEDQKPSSDRLKKAIEQRAEQIKQEMPGELWD